MFNNNQQPQQRCFIHLKEEGSGTMREVQLNAPLSIPITLDDFRHLHHSLEDVSTLVECDPRTFCPLSRGLILHSGKDKMEPGKHYIARRDANTTKSAPAVTFSSIADVREYSLSFAMSHQSSQSPTMTAMTPLPIQASNNNNNGLKQKPTSVSNSGMMMMPPLSVSEATNRFFGLAQQQQPQQQTIYPIEYQYRGNNFSIENENELNRLLEKDFASKTNALGAELERLLGTRNNDKVF
jgi:hypothetical protein